MTVKPPTPNESWIIDEGDRIIQKRAASGLESLVPWEILVFALWWADYAMRNGESLEAANENCDFKNMGSRAAVELSLPKSCELFGFDLPQFEREYLDRFDQVCDEIRDAK